MKKICYSTLFFCCILFAAANLFSQNTNTGNTTTSEIVRCGMNAHMEQLINSNAAVRKHHAKVQQWNKKLQKSPSPLNSEGGCENIITLPIAVHYQDAAAADADCLIALAYDQIARLNEDYSGTNFDLDTWFELYADAFEVGPGNTCLQFCLATNNHPAGYDIDEGQPAVTINQTTGDVDANWSGYLNIFVTDLTDILGYAPFPGLGNGDGVVITRCAFGSLSTCTSAGPNDNCGFGWTYNLGRTLTHELGHYLNLNHTWGEGGCSSDDGVTDTPLAAAEYFGCASLGATTTSCGSQDMFMNYMDYADDACMMLFTPEQGERAYDYASNFLGEMIAKAEIVCQPTELTEPIASINSLEEAMLCPADMSLSFSSTSTGGNLSYEWTFDGIGVNPSSSTTNSPTVSISESGSLTATLTVTNELGESSTETTVMVVILTEDDTACETPDCEEVAAIYNQVSSILPNGIAPAGNDCGQAFTYEVWQVWSSEGYTIGGVVAGTTYTIDICTGSEAGSWEPELAAQTPTGAYDGIVQNCSLTFTASESGTYLILINEVGADCNISNETPNGFISIQCVGATEICEEALAVTGEQDCEDSTYTLTITGGDGNYEVAGFQNTDEGVFVAMVANEQVIDLTINDGSVCEAVSFEAIVDCAVCETAITATGEQNCEEGTYTLYIEGGDGNYNVAGFEGGDGIFVATVANMEAISLTITDGSVCEGLDFDAIVDCPVCEQALAVSGEPNCEAGTFELTITGGDGNYTVPGFENNGEGLYSASAANFTDIVVTVSDGSPCESVSFEATVNCQNPPTAQDANLQLGFGMGSLDILLADYTNDANGDELIYAIQQPDQGGVVTFNPETSLLQFTPFPGFLGIATVTYAVSDGNSEPVNGIITIEVLYTCGSFDDLDANVIVSIDDITYEFIVYITINGGGFNQVDGSGYTVSANDFTTSLMPGQFYSSSVIVPSETPTVYPVTITDGLGCEHVYENIIEVALSAEVIDISGEVLNEGNLIKWTSASENNNSYYTLNRSNDGNVAEVKKLPGAGTSSTLNNYSFLDKEAPNGLSIYQLHQTDFDGTSSSLGAINLTRGEVEFGVVGIHPVPTTDKVTITFVNTLADIVNISVKDMAGRLVSHQQFKSTIGTNNYHLSLANALSGIYFVTLSDGTQIHTVKVIKE